MDYETQITRLYEQQLALQPDPYLYGHFHNRAVLRRHIHIFEKYADRLKGAKTLLDWGCRHAADACMARMLLGPEVAIDACDVDAAQYRVFHEFARLRYSELQHPYELPYEDNRFDSIIGSGVLEHVPNDSLSLAEIYRVLKHDGLLIITFLPNRYSYTEGLSRLFGAPHHRRRYSQSEIAHMLLHHGFEPLECGYHQMLPSLSNKTHGMLDSRIAHRLVESIQALNAPLERIPAVRTVASNIYAIARKVAVI